MRYSDSYSLKTHAVHTGLVNVVMHLSQILHRKHFGEIITVVNYMAKSETYMIFPQSMDGKGFVHNGEITVVYRQNNEGYLIMDIKAAIQKALS